jgi:hypothetical protein
MIPTKPPMMKTNAPRTNSMGLPTSKLMNMISDGPTMNVRHNIIAGPNARSYFNHSPGAEMPEIREESSFPVQGNIGSLIAEEGYDQYAMCSPLVDGVTIPNIGSSPNCSGTFRPDAYTLTNECGANCVLKAPESFGGVDFGYVENMNWTDKVTNAHQLHTYENVRATAEGKGSCDVFTPVEFIPRVSCDPKTKTSYLNPEPIYSPVPNFGKLKQYSNLFHVRYE